MSENTLVGRGFVRKVDGRDIYQAAPMRLRPDRTRPFVWPALTLFVIAFWVTVIVLVVR